MRHGCAFWHSARTSTTILASTSHPRSHYSGDSRRPASVNEFFIWTELRWLSATAVLDTLMRRSTAWCRWAAWVTLLLGQTVSRLSQPSVAFAQGASRPVSPLRNLRARPTRWCAALKWTMSSEILSHSGPDTLQKCWLAQSSCLCERCYFGPIA